jgi:hypothetical protein
MSTVICLTKVIFCDSIIVKHEGRSLSRKNYGSSDYLGELMALGFFVVFLIGVFVNYQTSLSPTCEWERIESRRTPIYSSYLQLSCKKVPLGDYTKAIPVGDQSNPVLVYQQTKTGYYKSPTYKSYVVTLPYLEGWTADQYRLVAAKQVIVFSNENYSKLQDTALINVGKNGMLAYPGSWYEINNSFSFDPSKL